MVPPVRVLTVDDQPLFLAATRELVDATPGFVVAGEETSGREALHAVQRLRPDLVLIDVRMPDMDGIELARALAEAGVDAVVVLVSGDDLETIRPLFGDSGAVALVQKERLRPALLQELWAVGQTRSHASDS